MNKIKIDIPTGMCIDMQNSNFNQGIIGFKPNINWNLVYYDAKEIEVNSAFPKKTKIINMIMHLATYLNNIATCNSNESWFIRKDSDGRYIPIMCTSALISFKSMDLAKLAINVIGKSNLDIVFNE